MSAADSAGRDTDCPPWPTEAPDAETMIRYAVGRACYENGLAWGCIDAGAFDCDVRDERHVRYRAARAQMIHLHDAALLLMRLRELDPAAADDAAREMWDAAEAGDSYGEWLWEWCRDAGLDGDAIYEAGKVAALAHFQEADRG